MIPLLRIVVLCAIGAAAFLLLFEFGHLQVFRTRAFILTIILPVLLLFLWAVRKVIDENRRK